MGPAFGVTFKPGHESDPRICTHITLLSGWVLQSLHRQISQRQPCCLSHSQSLLWPWPHTESPESHLCPRRTEELALALGPGNSP